MNGSTVHPMIGARLRWPAALPVQTQAVVFRDDLAQRAERLWPEDLPNWQANRTAWIKAVQMVRATKRGWVVDVRERGHA